MNKKLSYVFLLILTVTNCHLLFSEVLVSKENKFKIQNKISRPFIDEKADSSSQGVNAAELNGGQERTKTGIFPTGGRGIDL